RVSVARDLASVARRPQRAPPGSAADEPLPPEHRPRRRVAICGGSRARAASRKRRLAHRQAVHAMCDPDNGSGNGRAQERSAATCAQGLSVRQETEGSTVRTECDSHRRVRRNAAGRAEDASLLEELTTAKMRPLKTDRRVSCLSERFPNL